MAAKQNGADKTNNFLATALSRTLPNSAIKTEALLHYEKLLIQDGFKKADFFMLTRLQLLLQKLGEFETAISARSLLANLQGLNKINEFKIKIDNSTLSESVIKLYPTIRSKLDARTVHSIVKLLEILQCRPRFKLSQKLLLSSNPIYNHIYGKKIAIVGPSASTVNRGQEIDGYDLVVRINIKSDQSLPNSLSHGSRTDIIYLNGMWTERFKFHNYSTLLNSGCHFIWRHESIKHNIENSHYLTNVSNIEISGSLLMFPNVLIDLLRFQPASIDIFHIDFYTGEKIYEDNYKSEKNAKLIWDLAHHDLLTNINLINFIIAASETTIRFSDLAIGETSLDLMKFTSLMKKYQ
jgi:hypothetical protein